LYLWIALGSFALAGTGKKRPKPPVEVPPAEQPAPTPDATPSEVPPASAAQPELDFEWGPPAPEADRLVFIDELPTTLLPLYAATDADVRAHELLYDRIFYRSPVA